MIEAGFVDVIAPGEALDAGIEIDVVDLAGWILVAVVVVFDDVADADDDVFEAVVVLLLLTEMVLGNDFKRLLYEAV